MVLKKSKIKIPKIKIPYIRLNFQIVRQSDARWCERSGNLVKLPSYSINKNAMYDTKSLQLTYILIITTWKITILNSHRERTKREESRIWIKGVTYLHEI